MMDGWGPEDRAKLRRLTTRMPAARVGDQLGCTDRSVFRWQSGESDPLPVYRRPLRELFRAATED